MASGTQMVLSSEFQVDTRHGGKAAIGKRKTKRLIAVKKPMHLTLHSRFQFGRNRVGILKILKEESQKFKVRLFEVSINSNHIHLGTLSMTREGFKRFLRSIAGKIAQCVTGSRKGKALLERFWDYPPFTRFIEWGGDLKNMLSYIRQNQAEALGLIPYTPRKTAKKPSD